MELWEFNACVKEWNAKNKDDFEINDKSDIVLSWRIANFVNAALAGKLRDLDEYLGVKKSAPKISYEEFDELERRLTSVT